MVADDSAAETLSLDTRAGLPGEWLALYFPLFRRAEPTLAAGFALLDQDHKTLHLSLVESAEAANALLQALARSPEAAEGPAEVYAEAGARLLPRMARHLDEIGRAH